LQIADFGLNGTVQSAEGMGQGAGGKAHGAWCMGHWAERMGHGDITARLSAFGIRCTAKSKQLKAKY